MEGRRKPNDIDPDEIPLHGFRVAEPTGSEQAERESATEQSVRRMGPPRRYRMTPEGEFREIGDA